MSVPALLAVILAAAVAAADPSPTPSTTASPSPAATLAVVVVHIKNFAYDPAKVRISPGQTVRFVNDDEMAHTVTADDKSYDSGDMPKGKSWSHVFSATGTSVYFCYYHPFMKGSVEVVP